PIGIENEISRVGGEPSTRLILHALAQIMIEKGIMTREEFQQQIGLLTACDEGDPIQD
ncbi:MAG: hypothetical protein GY944_13770, partial [bacterium]|nr:hypothetical protein [bacterium]